MKKKIFLTGDSGQVGNEIFKQHDTEKFSVFCYKGDITHQNTIERSIENIKPDFIVNAAAYTNVEKAEKEIRKNFDTNAFAPQNLAKIAEKTGAKLVHFSTDYVFGEDGCQEMPHDPEEELTPMNMYGLAKALGEKLIKDTEAKHLILRTSWVYSERRNNFLKTMIGLAREKKTIRVVNDEIGAPTSARTVAAATLHAIEHYPTAVGTYHVTCEGKTSWAGFARKIMKEAKIKTEIKNICSDAYDTKARRPKNSRLDTRSFEETFNYKLPKWEDELTDVISILLE